MRGKTFFDVCHQSETFLAASVVAAPADDERSYLDFRRRVTADISFSENDIVPVRLHVIDVLVGEHEILIAVHAGDNGLRLPAVKSAADYGRAVVFAVIDVLPVGVHIPALALFREQILTISAVLVKREEAFPVLEIQPVADGEPRLSLERQIISVLIGRAAEELTAAVFKVRAPQSVCVFVLLRVVLEAGVYPIIVVINLRSEEQARRAFVIVEKHSFHLLLIIPDESAVAGETQAPVRADVIRCSGPAVPEKRAFVAVVRAERVAADSRDISGLGVEPVRRAADDVDISVVIFQSIYRL